MAKLNLRLQFKSTIQKNNKSNYQIYPLHLKGKLLTLPGVELWQGDRPPIEWISEHLAPQFGYRQVFDLPFNRILWLFVWLNRWKRCCKCVFICTC